MSKRRWPKGVTFYRAPPYRQGVWMTTSAAKFRQMQKYMGRGVDRDLGNGVTKTYYRKRGGLAILLGWFSGTPATLAHECSHAVWKILGEVGVKCETDNNEAFAYLLGDIVRKFWRHK